MVVALVDDGNPDGSALEVVDDEFQSSEPRSDNDDVMIRHASGPAVHREKNVAKRRH